jgi:hypothetical protein
VSKYDRQTKEQSEEWHMKNSRPKHAWADPEWKRLSFFFHGCGIVHKEFLPPGETVNHAFYKDVLEYFKTGPASLKGHCRRLGAAPW